MRSPWALLLLCACATETSAPIPSDPRPREVIAVPANTRIFLGQPSREDCSRPTGQEEWGWADHDAFEIDRDAVSCHDYKRCVAAGRCRAIQDWCYTSMRVPLDQARAYCEWQGARLPSYVEWVGAQYEGKELLPAWKMGFPCISGLEWPRCFGVTPRGFVFTHDYDEWTRDRDCTDSYGVVRFTVVDVRSRGSSWGGSAPADGFAAFRCVGPVDRKSE